MTMLEKILALIVERGLSQVWVEENSGLAENRITKWKNGQGSPSAEQALAIARLLGVPVDWLIDPQAELPPPSPEITESEKAVAFVMRGLKLSPEEAIRRLTEPAPSRPSDIRIGPRIDLEPDVVLQPAPRSSAKPTGQNKGADTHNDPGRIKRRR